MSLTKIDKILIPSIIVGSGVTAYTTIYYKQAAHREDTYWQAVKEMWLWPGMFNPLVLGALTGTGIAFLSSMIQR